MKNLSLKLDDNIFDETESILKEIKTSRNRYINEALTYYNRVQRKKNIAAKLRAESLMVQEESIKVLTDFENMENHDDQSV
jgi:metal-responsive CopG/Arc/MetJ family transcriptional regulator